MNEIRIKNLRLIAEEVGGLGRLAEAMEADPSFISQLIGKNPSKNIGRNTARKAEAAAGKPVGWLDADHDATSLNRDLLNAINTYVDDKYPTLPARARTDLIADLYYEAGGLSIPENQIHFAIDMWLRARSR